MSLKKTFATSARIFKQLGHDHRTLGLLFVVPVVLLGLLAWIYHATPLVFDSLGAPLLGIFPFVMMFVVTSITTLRERSGGTLERLLAMPVGKLDIILGYAISFGVLAMIQATLATVFAVFVYGLDVQGPVPFLLAVAVVDALLGAALGLFASAFARTEFQAVQFMPAFVLPQALLCGLVTPIAKLPDVLHFIANGLPLTYAVDAMQRVSREASVSDRMLVDVAVVLGFVTVAILLGALTLRRQTK